MPQFTVPNRTDRSDLSDLSRREFLATAIAATAGCTLASHAAPAKKPLNIVFILIDDLGWADTHCYGSEFYETPNIDALAQRGMRFTDAYAACPVCSPTRASIMTGKSPERLHFTNFNPLANRSTKRKLLSPMFDKCLRETEITLPRVLKENGYLCASIGKWDLGGPPSNATNRGFDIDVGGTSGGMAKSHFYPAWEDNPPIQGRDGEYLADWLTEEAEKFIESNKDKPFFLYLAHYSVHLPLEAKEALIEKYRAKLKPGQLQDNPVYAAMVQSVDESVGRVMAKLDQLGLAEDTAVFFTSDNGGLVISQLGFARATSNAPLRSGKGNIYEGGIREPLIVSWPGKTRPGSACGVPVSSIDYYPTILDMAGIDRNPKQVVDGTSIVPALRGHRGIGRDTLYWHYPHYSDQGGVPTSAIREGHEKLIWFHEDDHVELYDLEEDIGETNDRAKALPGRADALLKKLKNHLVAVGAQMATRNPGF